VSRKNGTNFVRSYLPELLSFLNDQYISEKPNFYRKHEAPLLSKDSPNSKVVRHNMKTCKNAGFEDIYCLKKNISIVSLQI
jgi:hypothetical protein